MNFVEEKRRTEIYAHPTSDCSSMCQERGNEKGGHCFCLVVCFNFTAVVKFENQMSHISS